MSLITAIYADSKREVGRRRNQGERTPAPTTGPKRQLFHQNFHVKIAACTTLTSLAELVTLLLSRRHRDPVSGLST